MGRGGTLLPAFFFLDVGEQMMGVSESTCSEVSVPAIFGIGVSSHVVREENT
jgi:hypothetical protein